MSGVNAVDEGSQRETAVVFRMRGTMQFKEERQTKSVSYRWIRCTLLNESAWSTERKCMRRYRGK